MSDDIRAVFAHYRKYHPRAHRTPNEKMPEWKKIAARMKDDGRTVEELCQAIDGCHRSAFHMGQNERRVPYNSLELIVRNDGQVYKFMCLAEAGTQKSAVSDVMAENIRTAQEWLEEERARGSGRTGRADPWPPYSRRTLQVEAVQGDAEDLLDGPVQLELG